MDHIISSNGNQSLIGPDGRAAILALENVIAKHQDAMFGDNLEMPLKHSFAPGVYVREIFIPKGSVLTGKIHRHAHPNFLMQGEVIVVTEHGGREHLKAPMSMISKAGTKRAVLALEDTVWITVHATDERDLKKIESYVIAPSYEAYELEQKKLSMSELESKNCLILALKDNKKDYRCLMGLEPIGTLLPFRAALKALQESNISTSGMIAHKQDNGIWHVLASEKGNLDGLDINESDMVGSWVAVAVGGSALVGAGVSAYTSSEASSAADRASNTQLQGQLDALRAVNERYNTARRQLVPLQQIGLRNLRRAEAYADPNSELSQQERAQFQRTLSRTLAARGLTGSGAEIAGLSDFELGLAQQRRSQAFELGNIGVSTLNNLANLQAGQGQLSANILTQGAAGQSALQFQGGQLGAQGAVGASNAFQGGILGLAQLQQQRQQQDYIRSLFSGSGGGAQGGDVFTPNYRFR